MPWNDKKLRPKPCLGRQLIKAKNSSRSGDSVLTSQRHAEELNDGIDFAGLDLGNVDKDTDMNKFLETAAAAAQDYEDVRRNIKLIDTDRGVPKVAPKEPAASGDKNFPISEGTLKTSASESMKQNITKPNAVNKFEDTLNFEFFAPPSSTLHTQGNVDLPQTLPPKGWKKAARSNKHIKTKRLYPRE